MEAGEQRCRQQHARRRWVVVDDDRCLDGRGHALVVAEQHVVVLHRWRSEQEGVRAGATGPVRRLDRSVGSRRPHAHHERAVARERLAEDAHRQVALGVGQPMRFAHHPKHGQPIHAAPRHELGQGADAVDVVASWDHTD